MSRRGLDPRERPEEPDDDREVPLLDAPEEPVEYLVVVDFVASVRTSVPKSAQLAHT